MDLLITGLLITDLRTTKNGNIELGEELGWMYCGLAIWITRRSLIRRRTEDVWWILLELIARRNDAICSASLRVHGHLSGVVGLASCWIAREILYVLRADYFSVLPSRRYLKDRLII